MARKLHSLYIKEDEVEVVEANVAGKKNSASLSNNKGRNSHHSHSGSSFILLVRI